MNWYWLKYTTRDRTSTRKLIFFNTCVILTIAFYDFNRCLVKLSYENHLKSTKWLFKKQIFWMWVSEFFLSQVVFALNILFISQSILFWIIGNPYKMLFKQNLNATWDDNSVLSFPSTAILKLSRKLSQTGSGNQRSRSLLYCYT